MTACENIDGHCGASWCDCEYQRKKQQSLAPATCSAYRVDCNAYGSEPLEYKTIMEALADNRIVSVTKQPDGRFQVQERCDEYYSGYLTREQLLAWAEELKALAGMSNIAIDESEK